MSRERLLLSRPQLMAFLACRRRFELRYLRRLPWPVAPLESAAETAVTRGQQFHRLLQRHFLGFSPDTNAIADPVVRRWWHTFLQDGPRPPSGTPLTEITLTVPVGDHLLHGRFDLLVIGTADGEPFAHLFDWKTGRAQDEADLRHDWQTRLYLALLAEGAQALLPGGAPPDPAHITMTYWYVNEPELPRAIQYSAAWHRENWAELLGLVAQIGAGLAQEEWPLTDDWSECRVCAYRAVCGRQSAGAAAPPPEDEAEATADFVALEPELP